MCRSVTSATGRKSKAITAYENALAELARKRERLIALKSQFDFAEEMTTRFPEREAVVSGSGDWVWITLHAASLADVQPFLAAIVRGGYHPHGRSDYVDEAVPRCTYDFSTERHFAGSRIIVNVYLSAADGRCRFEKVGEKTVPILKIVCDGEPGAAP